MPCSETISKNRFEYPESYIDVISGYFEKRRATKITGDDTLGIVLATSQFCNLACRHCAVSAQHQSSTNKAFCKYFSERMTHLIDKIHKYSQRQSAKIFLMFGGGEPTLLADFPLIVEYASKTFGKEHVGFCTNGTYLSPVKVLSIAENVGLLEVSIDGFKDYHNYWRPSVNHDDNYSKTLRLIKAAVKEAPEKLEVASIVTNKNLGRLPDFARFLRATGVRNYSIHRPVAIGRMAEHRNCIPNAQEYFAFFVSMAELCTENEHFSIHIHHSLESMYSSLFLGRDIHLSNSLMCSKRHSIGIDWNGNVHFDPWAMVPPLVELSAGNLLDTSVELEYILNSHPSVISLISRCNKTNMRCCRCSQKCSGGMRLAAIIDYLYRNGSYGMISHSSLWNAICSRDPACLLASGRDNIKKQLQNGIREWL